MDLIKILTKNIRIKTKKIIKNKILSTSNIQVNLPYNNYLITTTRKKDSSSNSLHDNEMKNDFLKNAKKKYRQPLTSK